MKIMLIIIFILISLFLIDRLMLFLEKKGYVYWRKVRPKSSTHSYTIQLLNEVFNPASKQLYEEKQKQKSTCIDKKKIDSKPSKDE